MAQFGGKLYGVSISYEDATDGAKRTKSINGLNIPPVTSENANGIATDLRKFAVKIIYDLQQDILNAVTFNSRQEVSS